MKPQKFLWTLLLALALALSACNAPAATSPTADELTPAIPPTATKPPQPTAPPTATPEPGKVILVAAAGSDPSLAQSAASLMGQLAAAEGMTFEEMPALSSAPAGAKIVVFLNPGTEIKNLAGNTPGVQFVAIGTTDLRPLEANLSQILLQPEATAFLAGYVAALAAPDWRIGGLVLDTPGSLQQSFLNGGKYHCGRCAPQYAPIVLFPVAKALPAGSDATAGWNAFKELDTDLLEVLYLDPALSSPELLAQLAAEGIGLIGSNLPEDETIRVQWIASVRADSLAALQVLWPDLLSGKGGTAQNAPLVVEDINPNWLSEGRIRLIEEAADGLENGSIAPFVP